MARGGAEAFPYLSSLISAAFILLLFTSDMSPSASHLSQLHSSYVFSETEMGDSNTAQAQKTWCVAKPSSDEATLLGNLNYACSQVDCSVLQRGSPCFYPDTLISHASIAMNLYYQAKGRNYWNCNFKNSALIVTTNPSFGSCAYT